MVDGIVELADVARRGDEHGQARRVGLVVRIGLQGAALAVVGDCTEGVGGGGLDVGLGQRLGILRAVGIEVQVDVLAVDVVRRHQRVERRDLRHVPPSDPVG